jgi:hypothetical protein
MQVKVLRVENSTILFSIAVLISKKTKNPNKFTLDYVFAIFDETSFEKKKKKQPQILHHLLSFQSTGNVVCYFHKEYQIWSYMILYEKYCTCITCSFNK